MPRRCVGAAVRSRSTPASVRAASAPRRSDGQLRRATKPSSTSRSMSRVAPLFESVRESARRPIRRRRSGASARMSRATYSCSDRPCSARRSSSSRRETWAWAVTKARHGARRASRAVRGPVPLSAVAIGVVSRRARVVVPGTVPKSYRRARCVVNDAAIRRGRPASIGGPCPPSTSMPSERNFRPCR
jgi:hypothetical protein